MSDQIKKIVIEFEADLLTSVRAGAGDDKLISLGFNATQALKQLLHTQTDTDDIHAAVLEVGIKTNMARKAISA